MTKDQLPLFKRKTFPSVGQQQILEPTTPTGESSVMHSLPAFQAYVGETYAVKTAKMYFGDIKELSLYLRTKKLKDIKTLDLHQWIAVLISRTEKS